MRTFEPRLHLDLREHVVARDGSAQTADSFDAIRRIARELRDDVGDLTDRATVRIVRTIPGYAATATVPREDLWWSVRRNIELVLTLVAQGRRPHDEELAIRGELGIRRARAGFPLADLMRAFRVGYLAIWQELSTRAHVEGPVAVSELAEQAALVWEAMDEVSSAVAEGYRHTAEAIDLDTRRRSLALLEALREHPLGDAAARARDLGFDPDGPFAVAVCERFRAGDASGPIAIAEQADRTVVVAALAGPEGERALAGRLAASGARHVGVGVSRSGTSGAARGLPEAERAHAAARALDRAVVAFRDEWFTCLTYESADGLAAILGDQIALLAEDRQAMETLAVVLAADGNLTRAAEELHLHPNGVAYRVKRIEDRTGLDIRSTRGLIAASAALTLASARTDGAT